MISSLASSVLMPVLRRLWVSLAETPMQNMSTPQASPRSRPFWFSTRPESTTPAGLRVAEVLEQAVGVGHLRHLHRVNEGAELEHVDPRAEQRLGPGDLLLRGHDSRLHLQPVAEADLVDEDPRRAHRRPTATGFVSPTAAAIALPISRVEPVPPMS